MKNRKSHSEHALLDNKVVRKRSIFERSAAVLANYGNLFKHSAVYYFGDADTYFKKTLRNYDELGDISAIRRAYRQPNKKKLQVGQGDYSKSKLVKPSISHSSVKLEEEDDEFFSPKSNLDSPGLAKMADDADTTNPGDEAENPDNQVVEGGEDEPAEAPAEGAGDTAPDAEEPPAAPPEEPEPEPEQYDAALDETEEVVKEASQALDEIEEDLCKVDDAAILREVEECEAQCMEIYTILKELKQRVHELLSKTSRTPQEDQELETKQKLLNEKMALLEQKTRRIQLLVGQCKKPDYNKNYDEDQLPKVVVCGLAENNMPKFIICDDKKRKTNYRKTPCNPITGPSPTCPASNLHGSGGGGMSPQRNSGFQVAPVMQMPPCVNVIPQFAKKLSDSYNMQERLAQENADLEGKRYQLQEDLLCKDQTVDSLQRQLTSLQCELRMIVKENGLLNSKLQQAQCVPCPNRRPPGSGDKAEPPKPKMPCGKGRAPCPASLPPDDSETKKLEKQLNEMEAEVRAIQNELSTVRQERLHLEQHRRMLSPMTAPTPPTCPAACLPPCPRQPDNTQLKELREQYNTLQDDYKSKLLEVAGLRADVEKLKVTSQEALDAKKALDDKIKELERLVKEYKGDGKGIGLKEQMIEMEQQMNVAKQRFRQAQDELEEMRALTEEQQSQLDDYRNKYLEAQQQVEEQKRQIDLMELENNRIGEQVNLEIQRVKNQFQEKLQELTPLPDILKATQLKLQEAQQMHMMAERNNEALLREIQALRDKAATYAEQMEQSRSDQAFGQSEKEMLTTRNAELQTRIDELNEENEQMQQIVSDMQDQVDDAERRAQEKLHEIAQLTAEVDNVREESARMVARTKDRCETIRRSMQNQVTDLEKQLAQSRASSKAAQKDRDDIRQKMQSQINNLNENFEDAQMRIRTLQGHVNFLKSSAAVYSSEQMPPKLTN